MNRRTAWLAVVGGTFAVALVAVALAFLGLAVLHLWPGERSLVPVGPGDVVKMDNGLSLTVPEGWTGFYKRFYRIPTWIPTGESDPKLGMQRSDYLVIGNPGLKNSPRSLMCMSLYGSRQPQEGRVLATTDDLRIVFIGDFPDAKPPSASVGIEIDVPGYLPGKASVSASREDPLNSLQRLWVLLKVRGAELPR